MTVGTRLHLYSLAREHCEEAVSEGFVEDDDVLSKISKDYFSPLLSPIWVYTLLESNTVLDWSAKVQNRQPVFVDRVSFKLPTPVGISQLVRLNELLSGRPVGSDKEAEVIRGVGVDFRRQDKLDACLLESPQCWQLSTRQVSRPNDMFLLDSYEDVVRRFPCLLNSQEPPLRYSRLQKIKCPSKLVRAIDGVPTRRCSSASRNFYVLPSCMRPAYKLRGKAQIDNMLGTHFLYRKRFTGFWRLIFLVASFLESRILNSKDCLGCRLKIGTLNFGLSRISTN